MNVKAGLVELRTTAPVSNARPKSMRIGSAKFGSKKRNKKFCDQCGRKNLADHKFCIGCGTNLKLTDAKSPSVSRKNSAATPTKAVTKTSKATPATKPVVVAVKEEPKAVAKPPAAKKPVVVVKVAVPPPPTTPKPFKPMAPAVVKKKEEVKSVTPAIVHAVVKDEKTTAVASPTAVTSAAKPVFQRRASVNTLQDYRLEIGESEAATRIARKKLAVVQELFDEFKSQSLTDRAKLEATLKKETVEKTKALESAQKLAIKLDNFESAQIRAVKDAVSKSEVYNSEALTQAQTETNVAISEADSLSREMNKLKMELLESHNALEVQRSSFEENLEAELSGEKESYDAKEKALLEEVKSLKDSASRIQAMADSVAGNYRDSELSNDWNAF